MRRRKLLIAGIVAIVGATITAAIYFHFGPDPRPTPSVGPTLLWTYEPLRQGGFVAPPTIADDTLFATVLYARGFRFAGSVVALDVATGKPRWTFDAAGAMLPTASAAVLANGRLYFGEGMHGHFTCKLRCLDATTGTPQWDFTATDHIESTPTVASGRVIFGAGNAGVYALDATTGKERWQFADDMHVDASPWVGNGRVIVGSGPSRRYTKCEVVALDEATGKPAWRTKVDRPAWGPPSVAGGRVFVGLGNGRLTEGAKPPETPTGAVLCLAEDDGRVLWTHPTPDSVFQRPTPVGDRVYFGCRDGDLSAVAAATGDILFRVPMGGPVIAPVTVADERIYVVSMNGHLRCLSPDGRERWHWDITARTQTEPLFTAGPRVVGNRLYLAGELQSGAGSAAVLYCFQLPE